ncbi:thialysine N-epsilon-acetyltransferase [Ochlerotatus camptorhynchus]|uniref:thialysine N-epsilon-acetyltransferase n=1 Tax=Ochlerotatus camptorhynchus TaxID=644619 RepID=UPI0031DFDBAF
MATPHCVIARKTRKEDLGAVLEMIQELADFEKMSDGPQLTVEDLIRDGGFDEDQSTKTPVFHSFVLELTDPVQTGENEEIRTSSTSGSDLSTRTKLIGYAICFYSYSTWQGKAFFLEDIYVKPDYRSHGYGKLLFTTLVHHARENGCSRFDFHVLAWNPAKKFYHGMGAENLTETEEWEFFRLTRDKMDKLCENSVK